MGKVLDEKCLNCGASITYDSKEDVFKCDYCHSKFTLEEINSHKEKNSKKVNLAKEFSKMEDMEGYHCNNCGATIITGDNTSSTKCVYCKSSAIIKNRLTGIYKPDSIIVFKQSKDDAITAFKNICAKRPLLPKDFSNPDNIQEMEGLYVPFWLYNIENDCYIKADCTNVKTWISGDYQYTKTDFYKVERGGYLTFENVPNDGATRFDDLIMNAIEPFDYSKLKPFEASYLAGFLSEKFDVVSDEAYKNAKQRIEEDAINYLKSNINLYTTTLVRESKNNVSLTDTKYVLLPVWVLNLKYKDQIYHFAMNGESGKLVGEIPVSKSKLMLTILITFILTFIITIIIFKLLGYQW